MRYLVGSALDDRVTATCERRGYMDSKQASCWTGSSSNTFQWVWACADLPTRRTDLARRGFRSIETREITLHIDYSKIHPVSGTPLASDSHYASSSATKYPSLSALHTPRPDTVNISARWWTFPCGSWTL